MLDEWEQRQLAEMRYHWDGAYLFTVSGDTWIATSLALPAVALTASSASELRAAVRRDYFSRLDARRERTTRLGQSPDEQAST